MQSASRGWTPARVVASLGIFSLSAFFEIVGGWLVWRAIIGNGDRRKDDANSSSTTSATTSSSSSSSSSSYRGIPTPASSSRARLWLLVPGCLFLVAYGFVPTLQTKVAPQQQQSSSSSSGFSSTNENGTVDVPFSRVYAVYGGVFVLGSYVWGWLADGSKPDVGDAVGAAVAVSGVMLAWFWPRGAARGGAGSAAAAAG